MITDSPRAGRSHSFGINTRACSFCGRGLEYFHNNGWGYCSASWTGQKPWALKDREQWQFGPIEWTRIGIVARLRVGPIALFIVGRVWGFGLS